MDGEYKSIDVTVNDVQNERVARFGTGEVRISKLIAFYNEFVDEDVVLE